MEPDRKGGLSFFPLLQEGKKKEELQALEKENGRTEQFGLSLTREEA